jgi:serine protease inhibitor
MKITNAFCYGLIIIALSAFTVSATAQGFDAPNTGNDNKLADADNGFAFDLLNKIAKEQPGQNIFISPFSAASALQMVVNGAAGQTKAEMQQVLNTTGIAQSDLNRDCKELNQALGAQTNVILELANGIWYQNNFQLKPQFIADNRDYFNAELAAVDFNDPGSANTINDWADKQTHGKITGVVSYPFPPITRMILANAIYFKGTWDDPFDKSLTIPRDFHQPDVTIKQVPMMGKRKTFSYEEGNGFQAVELPYAGDNLQMVLFLPATNSSPQQLLNNFSGETWRDKILPGFSDCEGDLMFPKFTLNYDVDLNEPLQVLGMNLAFDQDKADFSAMAGEPLFIGEVKQKSYVAVDEEGTEAAAVTTIEMEAGAAMPVIPLKVFHMIVDRPFFFVITDTQTQAILFMGIVDNPTQ